MIIVSACLAGIKCNYSGKDNACSYVVALVKKGLALPLCPEQLGGLPTPRTPAEIMNNQVLTLDQEDVTDNFRRGALETLKIANLIKCERAVLKQQSPSCGFGKVYDGTHSGKIVAGNGITAQLLLDNGIKIQTEEDLPEEYKEL